MASNWLPRKLRKAIYNRDAMRCAYCGKECKPATIAGMTRAEQIEHMRAHYADIVTIDHIVSRYELSQSCGDTNEYQTKITDPSSLITVCNGCNSSKRHTTLPLWAEKKGFNYQAIIARINVQTSMVIQ